ncbi:Serine/threonine-protein kinase D1 [Blattella germanica]|nr:Serine/threonine-protein kinase D1 [Blattella germanica]
MEGPSVTFIFQFGLVRDTVTTAASSLGLKTLKDLACDFINRNCPDHGLIRLSERLLLFRHDYGSPNILQHVNSAAEIMDETLVEIVLSSQVPTEEVPFRPHALAVHSYKSPTFCDFCGEMLFGLVRQGLKCEGCGLNFHKRCVVKIPNNCTSSTRGRRPSSNLQVPRSPSDTGSTSSLTSASDESGLVSYILSVSFVKKLKLLPGVVPRQGRSPSLGGRSMDRETAGRIRIPHTFVLHSYMKPTVCQYCRKLLRGLMKQGMQCKDCHYNAHKKCIDKIPKDCNAGDYLDSGVSSEPERECPDVTRNESDTENGGSPSGARKTSSSDSPLVNGECMDLIPGHDEGENAYDSSPSNNIPLMRIVQSVKYTKRRGSKVIKEGWMVHFTNKDPMSVTMFQSDTGSKYYKEIPLAEILSVDTARSPQGGVMHCFELRTANVDYFVGEDPLYGQKDTTGIALPPPDCGIGAHLAKSWETSIRQALMPVTSHPRGDVLDEPEENVTDISQLYQIIPDEVLGSGQFGIVYGGLNRRDISKQEELSIGVHRKTSRAVAIKVIDKLRFPTKQEAQLKNEVSILQNLSHCGVVNLERMFETSERIFVVMEKLKGDMLEMILSSQNGRLSERITKFLITQILIALKHLHSENIVHCDLKPENVLLSSDSDFPQVKLCDFGFARIIGEKSFRRSVVGTPAYLAIDLINNLLQVKQRKRYTVAKSLAHVWLQDYQTWCDLRKLEMQVGNRYLTHESDDARWESFRRDCL